MTAAIEIAASLILAAFVSWLVVRQHRAERAEVAATETPLFDATVAEHPQVALWILARELDDDEAVAAWIGDAS